MKEKMSQVELQLLKNTKYSAAAVERSVEEVSHISDVYIETPAKSKPSSDILQQFRANMTLVEELQNKLEFMTLEIKDVVKKL